MTAISVRCVICQDSFRWDKPDGDDQAALSNIPRGWRVIEVADHLDGNVTMFGGCPKHSEEEFSRAIEALASKRS